MKAFALRTPLIVLTIFCFVWINGSVCVTLLIRFCLLKDNPTIHFSSIMTKRLNNLWFEIFSCFYKYILRIASTLFVNLIKHLIYTKFSFSRMNCYLFFLFLVCLSLFWVYQSQILILDKNQKHKQYNHHVFHSVMFLWNWRKFFLLIILLKLLMFVYSIFTEKFIIFNILCSIVKKFFYFLSCRD